MKTASYIKVYQNCTVNVYKYLWEQIFSGVLIYLPIVGILIIKYLYAKENVYSRQTFVEIKSFYYICWKVRHYT